ncbi:MAG: putative DNA binding domain-containing protein [Roseburia sp.]|nr:putative DNA binding domain-containing protein [Roseburia sp.]
MDAIQLKNLISKGEGVNIEFKTSQEELSQSGFETIVSFLNTIGGHLFLGVSNDGQIVGVDEEKISSIKTNFANLVNNKEKINPPVPLAFQDSYIDSKFVLYVYVPESSEVHKMNNHFIFVRTDDGDRDITDIPYAVKKLYLRKSGAKTEDFVYNELTMDDFNRNTIQKARKLATIHSPNHNWKDLSDEEILHQKYFYKKNSETGKEGFTLSALLLFGKTESIMGLLSWYKVDVLKKIKDIERYDDRFICEENLIDSYDALLKYIDANVEKPFYLNNDGVTYNAVGVVVRELVSNVLIHREFIDQSPARILIYKDKIICENANSPKLFTDVDLNHYEPCSKNSTIARIFRMIGYADEIGSGFTKIKNICDNFFKSTPSIVDKDTFKTEISLISDTDTLNYSLSQKDMILDHIKKNGRITNEQCRKLLNIEKSRASELLTNLSDNQSIYRHGVGKSTYYDLNK